MVSQLNTWVVLFLYPWEMATCLLLSVCFLSFFLSLAERLTQAQVAAAAALQSVSYQVRVFESTKRPKQDREKKEHVSWAAWMEEKEEEEEEEEEEERRKEMKCGLVSVRRERSQSWRPWGVFHRWLREGEGRRVRELVTSISCSERHCLLSGRWRRRRRAM